MISWAVVVKKKTLRNYSNKLLLLLHSLYHCRHQQRLPIKKYKTFFFSLEIENSNKEVVVVGSLIKRVRVYRA